MFGTICAILIHIVGLQMLEAIYVFLSDCPKYELFLKNDSVGTCDVIGEDAGSVTLPYCIQHCLDMTGCQAVSFYGNSTTCYYHDCANNTQLVYGNTTFIQRSCVTDGNSCYTHFYSVSNNKILD